jgi:flavorubredoxin
LVEIDVTTDLLRQSPLEIAPDTFVIRAATRSVGDTSTSLNSMLIRAAEPVIVDTGIATARDAWFADLCSLIDPQDVRWIVVTHLDTDHSGNMMEALEHCRNACLVTTPGESFRVMSSYGVPANRIRLIDFGEDLDAGDRVLRSLRPPVYDSPYTRALLDPSTGVLYTSDAFCTPMPAEPVDRLSDIPTEDWLDGMARFHHASLCPWLTVVDEKQFGAEVEKLADVQPRIIVGAHSPVIDGASVEEALSHLAQLPAYLRASARVNL